MKITRIKIENFRSIKKTEFKTTDFNIFIGQNNCGKTNFFEAIEFFFNGISAKFNIDDLKFLRKPENEILIAQLYNRKIEGYITKDRKSFGQIIKPITELMGFSVKLIDFSSPLKEFKGELF
jgi:AAA15 family ATPase/GTPase